MNVGNCALSHRGIEIIRLPGREYNLSQQFSGGFLRKASDSIFLDDIQGNREGLKVSSKWRRPSFPKKKLNEDNVLAQAFLFSLRSLGLEKGERGTECADQSGGFLFV